MEALRGLLIAMAGISLLAAATDHLLPPGRSRQIALFVLGLVMLITMIAPITRLLGRVPEEIASLEAFRMDEAYVRQESSTSEEEYRQQVWDAWRRRLEAAAEAIATQHGAVAPEAVAVFDRDGSLSELTVRGAGESLELRSALSARLGVAESTITLIP